MSIRTLIASVVSQAPADSTPTSVAAQSNRRVARAASPSPSISFDETAQHGVGVEGVDGPRGVSSRLTHFAPSHHSVAQTALIRTQGELSRITKNLALFVSKNRKLKVLGFMPIMALLLTPAVVFAGVLA
jgi:hypothetical protein